MRHSPRSALTIPLLALLACSPGGRDSEVERIGRDAPLSVYVVNHPLAYMARRIGGAHVDVVFPAPADIDPADWTPDPETVAAYQGADLVLRNGAGYARWLAFASLREERIIDTSAAFRDRLIVDDHTLRHQHGPDGEHTNLALAHTTWLDPSLAIEQARAITKALVRVRPEHAGAFADGLAGLEADLAALDARLAAAARKLEGKPLLFSHPVYAYLIHRYGLNARSMHLEPDETPDLVPWDELRRLLAEHPARVMLWEAEPDPDTAADLRALGVRSVVFAPCGNVPDEGELLTVMHRNAAVLETLRP